MEIKRPNYERLHDMKLPEHMEFWLIVIRTYSHAEVRRDSLLLYNNTSKAVE